MKLDTRKSSVGTDIPRAVILEDIVPGETLEDTAPEDIVPEGTLEDTASEGTAPVEIWEAATRAALTDTEERRPAMVDLRVV